MGGVEDAETDGQGWIAWLPGLEASSLMVVPSKDEDFYWCSGKKEGKASTQEAAKDAAEEAIRCALKNILTHLSSNSTDGITEAQKGSLLQINSDLYGDSLGAQESINLLTDALEQLNSALHLKSNLDRGTLNSCQNHSKTQK